MKYAKSKIFAVVTIAVLALAGCTTETKSGNAYPDGPITLIVSSDPGTAADTSARHAAPILAKELGVKVEIQNVPGGSGTIGTAEAARSKGDGYTLLWATYGPLMTQPHLLKLPYNPAKELRPVAVMGTEVVALMVESQNRANTVAEFVEMYSDFEVKFGTFGRGSFADLITTEFIKESGLKNVRRVPFTSAQEANAAVLNGTIDAVFTVAPQSVATVEQGRTRFLAVGSTVRYKFAPDVPTMTEEGYGALTFLIPTTLMVPVDTPKNVVSALEEAAERVTGNPAFIEAREKGREVPFFMSTVEAEELLDKDYPRYESILAGAGD